MSLDKPLPSLRKTSLMNGPLQDLPEDRFDDAVHIMTKHYLADAPLMKLANAANDSVCVQESIRIWKKVVQQRMMHLCFKDGSSDIVGLNTNFVSSRGDPSLFVDIKSEALLQNMRVRSILNDHGNFNVFEKYGVDKYLSSFGIQVRKEYSGRKIGEKMLEASKYLAQPCELKLRHAFFPSNISNKIADNLEYKTDAELSFKEIQHIDPSLKLDNIESSKATLRTWIFEVTRNS